jgi:protein-S-isoprenylcysteine O-methyltransferase Ste14
MGVVKFQAERFTPFLIFQILAVVLIIIVMMLWPGEWNVSRWIGLMLALPSAILLIIARYQIGRSFSVTPQARELVTHGLYSKIRNPIYVFAGLFALGVLLVLQMPVLFILFAIMIPVQIVRARQEAKVLENKFGDAYREYRKTTWF